MVFRTRSLSPKHRDGAVRPHMSGGAALGRRGLLAMLASLALGRPAVAQPEWPNRAIRIVTIFVAGGSGDTAIRALGAKASEALGQPIVIEPRPGGQGVRPSSVTNLSPHWEVRQTAR